jgi:hypothetical protein
MKACGLPTTNVQNEGLMIFNSRCTKLRHTNYQEHISRLKAYRLPEQALEYNPLE